MMFFTDCINLALDGTIESDKEYRERLMDIILDGDQERNRVVVRAVLTAAAVSVLAHRLVFRSYWKKRLAGHTPRDQYFRDLIRDAPVYFFLKDTRIYYFIFPMEAFR